MRRHAALSLLWVAATLSCATPERSVKSPASTSTEAPAPVEGAAAAAEPEGVASPPEAPAEPPEEPAPPPPNPVPVEGEGALLALLGADGPATVRMGSFDVACLAHPSALEAPAVADRSLEEVAKRQGVTLGRLLLVRIERDPTRRRAEGASRVCRPVSEKAELYAPLFREREAGGRWVVAQSRGDVAADLARLLQSAAKRGAPADRPRALVVEDRVVMLALPLAGAGDRAQGE